MYSCTSENRVGAFSCEYLGQASSESNATCVGINNNNDDSIRSYKAFCNYNSRVVNKFYSDNTCTSESRPRWCTRRHPTMTTAYVLEDPPYLHLAMPPAQTLAIRTTTPIIGTELTMSLLCNNSLVYSCTGQNQTGDFSCSLRGNGTSVDTAACSKSDMGPSMTMKHFCDAEGRVVERHFNDDNCTSVNSTSTLQYSVLKQDSCMCPAGSPGSTTQQGVGQTDGNSASVVSQNLTCPITCGLNNQTNGPDPMGGSGLTLVNTVWTQRCIHVPARTGLALSVVNTWGKLALRAMPLASGLITITTIQLEVIKLSAITTRVL